MPRFRYEEQITELEDFSSLFRVVQQFLTHTTSVAENCLLGNNETITPDSKAPVSSIKCPLKVLKRIHCAVACVAGSEPNVSASVIKLLSGYPSWAGRAVLTLAAFALSYGELLFYVDNRDLNTFARLLSSLRRVDEIIRVKQDEQFKTAMRDLNVVTTRSVDFIGLILELENLSKNDGINMSSVTEITTTLRNLSSSAIGFVVKCLILVNFLAYEDDRIMAATDLSSLAASVESELETLKQDVEKYKSRTVEWEARSNLDSSIRGGLGIVKVITCMMYPSSEPYLDRYKEGPVKVDQQLLKGNNVLLFISRLDNLSEADFSALKTIHEMLEKEHRNYKIVWIPVLEGGRDLPEEEQKKLNKWKERMPWYVVSYEASKPIIGIMYIKETWQFSYNPMVVVLNQDGAVKCPDAMHMIRAWEFSAFPFIPQILPSVPGVGPIISTIIKREIKEEEYVFLYGGAKDQAWISGFGEHVGKLAADDQARQKISLKVKTYPIGEKSIEKQFWTRIESMLCARMQYWNTSDDGTAKQIQKLLSLKQDETGWAMLCKGSSVLVCTSGTLINEAVSKYQEWAKNMDKKKFEGCLLDYLETLKRSDEPRTCCHIPFQSLSGWIPGEVKCPVCGAGMERIVTYKCCHGENTNK